MPLLTCYISVVIVATGAARIYRGLVERAASSHREAQASFECCDERQREAGDVKDGDIV
jgi:hypothetical protein